MNVTSTAILVTWDEVDPEDQNGEIVMYEIKYVPLETCSRSLATKTVAITDTSMLATTLTDLEEYVEYNISVRAYTSVGAGPYSDPVIEKTLEDGEVPQWLSTSTKLLIFALYIQSLMPLRLKFHGRKSMQLMRMESSLSMRFSMSLSRHLEARYPLILPTLHI